MRCRSTVHCSMLFCTTKSVIKKGTLKIQGCPEYSIQVCKFYATAVSRSASVFLPETSSLPACSVRAARAVVVPVVPSAGARSGLRTLARRRSHGAAELAHSGWTLADYSAGLRAMIRLGLSVSGCRFSAGFRSIWFRLVLAG